MLQEVVADVMVPLGDKSERNSRHQKRGARGKVKIKLLLDKSVRLPSPPANDIKP